MPPKKAKVKVAPVKKKVATKKKKAPVKKKKQTFKVINTEQKVFKDGRKLNIVTYKTRKNVNPQKIYDFINNKSTKMSGSNIFRNARLNLQIKFGFGWRSQAFADAGTQFEFLLDYADQGDLDDSVEQFKIAFIV